MSLMVLIGLLLGLLEFSVTRDNFFAPWNGFGAMFSVYKKTALAPMRYRVLFPYLLVPLIRRMSPQTQNLIYQSLKTVFLTLSLVLMYNGFGLIPALILAVLVAVAFQFDYWECYIELATLIALLTAGPVVALVLFALLALSRPEVVPFAMPLYAIAAITRWDAGWLIGAASAIPLALVVAVSTLQGTAKLYCHRFEITSNNSKDLRGMWENLNAHMLISFVFVLGSILVLIFRKPPIEMALIPLFWIPAGILFGRVSEPRVFMPLTILIAWALA